MSAREKKSPSVNEGTKHDRRARAWACELRTLLRFIDSQQAKLLRQFGKVAEQEWRLECRRFEKAVEASLRRICNAAEASRVAVRALKIDSPEFDGIIDWLKYSFPEGKIRSGFDQLEKDRAAWRANKRAAWKVRTNTLTQLAGIFWKQAAVISALTWLMQQKWIWRLAVLKRSWRLPRRALCVGQAEPIHVPAAGVRGSSF